ncbi:hypothetical protein JXA47_15090, partial [Candidatus Sumerlaeota bacterium]|nr:hypothetical protein [Candidatus Sumerlaeota bacterium]
MTRHLGPLALLMLAIAPMARADDLFAASTFNTDILRLISVNSSGEMFVLTNLPVSNEGFDVSADPYGRFTACATAYRVFLHRVGPGMNLGYADHFEREDYFFLITMALSPDGRTAVVFGGELDAAISSGEAATMSPSDNRFFLKTFSVNNRLELVETGHEFPLPWGDDILEIRSIAISPVGNSTIVMNLPTADDVSFAALHLTTDGEIIDEGARAGDGLAYNSRLFLSSDGRYAVVSKDWSALLRIEDDRTLTIADFLPFPTWAPRNP